jgi:hypothetical protein
LNHGIRGTHGNKKNDFFQSLFALIRVFSWFFDSSLVATRLRQDVFLSPVPAWMALDAIGQNYSFSYSLWY